MTNTQQMWEQLPEKVQASLIECYRYTLVDEDWWRNVYDNFEASMEVHGITVSKMYFSGFWSQGDGACFDGGVTDWGLFLMSFYQGPVPQHMVDTAIDEGLHFSCEHSGYYFHENSVNYTTSLYLGNPFDADDDPVRHIAWAAVNGEYGYFITLKDAFKEFFRYHMRRLYRELEAEHDYLVSDETVREYILDMQSEAVEEAWSIEEDQKATTFAAC